MEEDLTGGDPSEGGLRTPSSELAARIQAHIDAIQDESLGAWTAASAGTG